MNETMILAIESSCDETAVAIMDSNKRVHAHLINSQISEHAPYGGVVPEIAARAHSAHLDHLIVRAMRDANISFDALDAVAATAGPGLIGGVIVGVMTAKAIACVHRLPFYAINHLEGHALSVRLEHDVPFPYLLFLMSGGHCQIMLVRDVGEYDLLGSTLDDAIGEAFDKTAKMMGLGYPGGPAIEAIAKHGDASRFKFPKPYIDRPGCDMSFSGLKTAVRTCLLSLNDGKEVSERDKADIAACLQHTLRDIIINRLEQALTLVAAYEPRCNVRHIVIAGGVAANNTIRHSLEIFAEANDMTFVAPSPALCTDNAAMIGWAALERIAHGFPADTLDTEPRARWPLDDNNTN